MPQILRSTSGLILLRVSRNMAKIRIIAGFALLVLGSRIYAQTPDPRPPGPPPDPQRPFLSPLPQEQNWFFLQDPSKRVDWLDRLKYIRLGNSDNLYLSFGGEFRAEYERTGSTLFGRGPQDTNGYYLQRFLPHVDLHLGPHLRVYSELQFDDIFGRNGGPRPGIDRDQGAFHQVFAEFSSNLNEGDGVRLRVGRQELGFGTGRLVDNNEGVNVKFSFDGARLTWRSSGWEATLFAVKPVQLNPGFFDDSPESRQTFWGAYATAPLHIQSAKLDFYYLGLDTKQAVYNSGIGAESRSSFGFRLFNRPPGALPLPGPDYNWEAIYQSGSFAGASIRAWTVATDTGYTWRTPLQVRLALRADAASGDGNPADRTLNAFNPLFPRGAYFAPKFALIAPSNIYDLHPVVFYHPRQNITASIDAVWFWRQNLHDGLYGYGGSLFQRGTPAQSRYIGNQVSLEIRWALTSHVTLVANPAVLVTGAFLQQSQLSHNIAFVNLGLTYRF